MKLNQSQNSYLGKNIKLAEIAIPTSRKRGNTS